MKYILGVDCGTGGVRVGIFDLEGRLLVFASESVKLSSPRVGWAEQLPNDWQSAMCMASRNAVQKAGVDPRDIIGMSVSSTVSTILFLNEDMRPIYPAIMWCDVRSSQEADLIKASGSRVLKYNGFANVSAEWAIPKIMWVKKNRPEIFEKSKHICECLDYLSYLLTGELVSSINAVTARWYYDSRNGGWPTDFYDSIGLSGIIEKFPSTVRKLGEPLGKLKPGIANDMGLVPGIIVGVGGCDAYLATFALGVVKPGSIAMGTGTSNLQYALLEEEVNDKGFFGAFPDAVIDGYYAIEGGQTTTGGLINWFSSQYCDSYKLQAEQAGLPLVRYLDQEAAKLPIGSEGLIILDYFQGNRTPWVDNNIRGLIYGLSLKHTPVHIFRAIIEAVCFGTALIIETFIKYMEKPETMSISGGLTKSELYLQTLADVCDMPILLPECIESPCFGAAILGAIAAGAYGSIAEASSKMVRFVRRVEPIPANREQFKFYFEKYKTLYPLIAQWGQEITNHIAAT